MTQRSASATVGRAKSSFGAPSNESLCKDGAESQSYASLRKIQDVTGLGMWIYRVRPLYVFTDRSKRGDDHNLASCNSIFVSTKGTDEERGDLPRAKRAEGRDFRGRQLPPPFFVLFPT